MQRTSVHVYKDFSKFLVLINRAMIWRNVHQSQKSTISMTATNTLHVIMNLVLLLVHAMMDGKAMELIAAI